MGAFLQAAKPLIARDHTPFGGSCAPIYALRDPYTHTLRVPKLYFIEKTHTKHTQFHIDMSILGHKTLHLTTSRELLVWTQLVIVTNDYVGPQKLRFQNKDISIQNKPISRSNLLSKISNLVIWSIGKILLFYFDRKE